MGIAKKPAPRILIPCRSRCRGAADRYLVKALEANGLITSRIYSDHPPRLEYHLTEKGKSLGPVLKALREWGQRHI
jgi:hypothetical protein